MNIDKLKTKIREFAKKNNLTVQEAWDKYFFDSFLVRLSMSDYKDEFVLKGGFLLENIIGVEHRTTLDLDFSYKVNNISIDILREKIGNILKLSVDDNVSFEVKDIMPITEQDKYEGYQIRINGIIGNIKKTFGIDVATGDTITPSPNILKYYTSITNKTILIKSYNIETALSEKFQTVIDKHVLNTRMKDFYDIFVLINSNKLDKDLCHDALVNTFEARGTSIKKHEIDRILKNIASSKLLEKMYDDYSRKVSFAKKSNYLNIVEALDKVKRLIKYQNEFVPKFKSLLLIRHGEDAQNKTGGWSDNNLTENGIKQMKKLRENLKNKITITKNSKIISSDLKRAKESTNILFDFKDKIQFEPRLRECNNGDLANITKEVFKQKYPGLYFNTLKYDEKYPNGESPKDYYKRVSLLFAELNHNYENKDLIIIAHAGTYGILKSMINGIVWTNNQKYKIDYAEYFEFIR